MIAENSGIRFVIIGYGHIGQRYAELLLKQNGAVLAGIVDVKITSAPVEVPYYPSIEALLDDQLEFDAAIIAIPNGLHAAHAIQCLDAGKHVVIESPIALSQADAALIYETAEKNQKSVFPVFQNRYAVAMQWLKETLENQKLGKIFMIQVNCFWNRDENYYAPDWRGTKHLDGGVLQTQFSHYIDGLIWLFGDLSVKKAELFNFKHPQTEIEDSGVVQFGIAQKGAVGTLNFSTATFAQNYESSILILAENGTVKLGGQYMDQIVYQHAVVDFPNDLRQDHANHQLFIKDLVQRLQAGERSLIGKTEVFKTISLIADIYQNAENNQDIKNSPIFAS